MWNPVYSAYAMRNLNKQYLKSLYLDIIKIGKYFEIWDTRYDYEN